MQKHPSQVSPALQYLGARRGSAHLALLLTISAVALALAGCGNPQSTNTPPPSSAPRAETTAPAEQPIFSSEGAPVAVNGISGLVTLVSPTEIRIVVGIQNGRSMLPYVRAAAFLSGLDDAPLSATRSANDRYLSIPLPEPVAPPYSTIILLADNRTGDSTKTSVTLTTVSPSPDDHLIDGLETTATAAGLKTGMYSLLKRISKGVMGGDYELAVTLAPLLANSARAYASAAQVDTTTTRMLLSKIDETPQIFAKAAATMDDGIMGTTVEALENDLLPALESHVMQAVHTTSGPKPENFDTPRATVYVDLNKAGKSGFTPASMEVPKDMPFMLIVRLSSPGDHAFRLARVGDFESPDFTSDAASTSTLASGIYTLPRGRHILACMKHPSEKVELFAGLSIPPPAPPTPASVAPVRATSDTLSSPTQTVDGE